MPGVRSPQWGPDSWAAEFGKRVTSSLHTNWPMQYKMAVVLTFDTHGDIDAARKNYQATCLFPDGSINYMDQMEREYGIRRGLPRILSILRKNGIKATFPTCGACADWYPEAVRAIHADGHEVAAHGYWHHNVISLNPDEQAIEIEDCAAAIERAIGVRPRGWRSPMHSGTGTTLDKAIEAGLTWAADFANDDLPYWIERPSGRRILAFPSCMNDLDMSLMPPAKGHVIHANGSFYNSSKHVMEAWIYEFDMLYEESLEGSPQIVSLTFHPRITGRPFRAKALDEFIKYARSREGVWFPRISDLAELA